MAPIWQASEVDAVLSEAQVELDARVVQLMKQIVEVQLPEWKVSRPVITATVPRSVRIWSRRLADGNSVDELQSTVHSVIS
jgi:hypothetical protein